jgi:hypothetical protein
MSPSQGHESQYKKKKIYPGKLGYGSYKLNNTRYESLFGYQRREAL